MDMGDVMDRCADAMGSMMGGGMMGSGLLLVILTALLVLCLVGLAAVGVLGFLGCSEALRDAILGLPRNRGRPASRSSPCALHLRECAFPLTLANRTKGEGGLT
jgi:hypothetical protein